MTSFSLVPAHVPAEAQSNSATNNRTIRDAADMSAEEQHEDVVLLSKRTLDGRSWLSGGSGRSKEMEERASILPGALQSLPGGDIRPGYVRRRKKSLVKAMN